MKKEQYKLIETYPDSPSKVGTIITKNGAWWQTSFGEIDSCILHKHERSFNPKGYPKNWQKIDYEILSFRLHQHCIAKLGCDGLYHTVPNDQIGKTLEEMLAQISNIKMCYTIHSVKRLSDGEVFTVGDKIKLITGHNNRIIAQIVVIENEIRFNNTNNGEIDLDKAIKIKSPLFTTEDGVDVFEGDYVYSIGDFIIFNYLVKENNTIPLISFSTKEKAEQYILMNNPQISLKTISDTLKKLQLYSVHTKLIPALEKLITNKND